MNPVDVYNINLYHFNNHHEEKLIRNVIIPQLILRDYPNGMMIIANIGHFLSHQQEPPPPPPQQ